MKATFLTTFFCAIALTVFSQNWQTDFTTAQEIAARENKQIIMVFQGSDWCAPCIKLDHEVWSTDAFQIYAKEHYVMLKVDFPRSRKNALSPEQQEHNNHLAELYNTQGYFPAVVVLDKSGSVKGSTGYLHMSPNDYIAHLNSLKS